MEKLKQIIGLTGLTMLLTFAGNTLADPSTPGASSENGQQGKRGKMGKHGKMRGEKRQGKMMKEMQQLDLSEDQKKKMKALHETHRTEMKASRESAKTARDDFSAAMQSGDKSDADLNVLHEKMIESKAAQMRQKFQHMLQVRQILTVEQRTKFRGMMQDGPGEGPGPGDGPEDE